MPALVKDKPFLVRLVHNPLWFRQLSVTSWKYLFPDFSGTVPSSLIHYPRSPIFPERCPASRFFRNGAQLSYHRPMHVSSIADTYLYRTSLPGDLFEAKMLLCLSMKGFGL